MKDHGKSYEEVVSPIVSARLKEVASELNGKIRGVLKVNCSLRHVSRDLYEATISVDLKPAGSKTVVARKASKNVFTAMNEATKAVLRQVFSRKEKLTHGRRESIEGEDLVDIELPQAS